MVRAPNPTTPYTDMSESLLTQAINAMNVALRILHVDDTEDILQLQRLYLTRRSQLTFDYIGVMDSATAFETITSWQPDLILSDISRPCMDGYTFTKLLKSRHDTQAIPVVFLTAQCSSLERNRALAVGATALITKPGLPHLSKLHHLAAQARIEKIISWVALHNQIRLMQMLMDLTEVDDIMRVEIIRWLKVNSYSSI